MIRCPACQAVIPPDQQFCPICRADLTATPLGAVPLAIPVYDRATGLRIDPRVDYRALARRQRWVLWLLVANVIVQLAPFYLGMLGEPLFNILATLMVLTTLALMLAMLICVVRLLTAQGTRLAVVILCAVLLLAPCANLLLLLLINMSATRTLRRAGIRVGLMGAKDEDVLRITTPNLCKGCGYDLTGNVSGVCPECGAAIPSAVRASDCRQAGDR